MSLCICLCVVQIKKQCVVSLSSVLCMRKVKDLSDAITMITAVIHKNALICPSVYKFERKPPEAHFFNAFKNVLKTRLNNSFLEVHVIAFGDRICSVTTLRAFIL